MMDDEKMMKRLAEATPRMESMANKIGNLMADEYRRIDTRDSVRFGDALTIASSTVLSVMTEAMAKAIITTAVIKRGSTEELTELVMKMVKRSVAKLEANDTVREGRDVVEKLAAIGGDTVTLTIEMPDLSDDGG